MRRLTLPTGGYITNDYDTVSRQLLTRLVKSDDSELNGHDYAYNPGNQRTNQTRVTQVFTNGNWYLATNEMVYGYDGIGQLRGANGKEAGGSLRMGEQFAYKYDAAGNLTNRVQNLFTNTFNVNSLNELTTVSHPKYRKAKHENATEDNLDCNARAPIARQPANRERVL